jgi:hypothetical protein
MVVGWRDRISIDPTEVAHHAGHWEQYTQGLLAEDFPTLASGMNLEPEPAQSYTIDAFRNLLETKGPLWVAADVPGFHAIVVTGIYGDGSPSGEDTYVRINDPWDRDPGTPGSPGPYRDTHDAGSRYVLTWRQFVSEYENVQRHGDDWGDVRLQILHAAGTDGRRPRSGPAQAQALQVPPSPAVPIAAQIVGTVMTRVLNNQGDIRWELDQMRGVKRPHDDAAQEGSQTYTRQTTLVEGPHASTVLGIDHIYADFEISWESNGRSVANVAITRKKVNDAVGAGLTVKGLIQDEANVYTVPGGTETFAAVHVIFTYDFDWSEPFVDNFLADTKLTLYGNGYVAKEFRWTQT